MFLLHKKEKASQSDIIVTRRVAFNYFQYRGTCTGKLIIIKSNTVTGKKEFWSPNVDLQTLSSRLEINERTVSIEDNFCRQCSTM